MDRYLEHRQIGQAEQHAVNQTLLKLLSPNSRTKYTTSSFDQQMKYLTYIRRTYGHENIQTLSQQLNSDGISKLHTERTRTRLNHRETKNLPIRHLLATLGYETEFPLPKQELISEDLIFLDAIGIRLGLGNMTNFWEISPGPFWSYKTGVYIFLRFLQAGLIDLDNCAFLGLHTNTGAPFKNPSRYFQILALISKATSYTSRNLSTTSSPEYKEIITLYSSSLHNKTSDEDNSIYKENKDNTIQTVSGFVTQMFFLESLYAAINALLLQDRAYILTSDQKALADTFKQLLKEWEEACITMELPDLASGIPGKKSVARLVNRVEVALPTTPNNWGRWARQKSSWEIIDRPLMVRDRYYPNVVAFARDMCWRYSIQAQNIFHQAMVDFLEELKAAKEAKGERRKTIILALFLRFPCGLPENASYNKKYKLFKRLVTNYLD